MRLSCKAFRWGANECPIFYVYVLLFFFLFFYIEQAQAKVAMKQAIALGFTEVPIQTTHFKLFSLVRVLPQKKEVAWVYLEGDGKAYLNRSTVSHNPTPQHPVALKIAMSLFLL